MFVCVDACAHLDIHSCSLACMSIIPHVNLLCVFSESCSREEFMCDSGRCLLPVSVCDGHPNCHDQTDEANCSHKHKGESLQTVAVAVEHCFYLNLTFPQSVAGRKPGRTVTCQVQTTPDLILTSRYSMTQPNVLHTGLIWKHVYPLISHRSFPP